MDKFYQSFLLRIWKNKVHDESWHASLEDPTTHQIITFNHPDALFEYLLQLFNFTDLQKQ